MMSEQVAKNELLINYIYWILTTQFSTDKNITTQKPVLFASIYNITATMIN